jgi:exopolysaccharide production protein ExoY
MNHAFNTEDRVKILFMNDAPLPVWKRIIDLACCLVALPFFAVATVIMAILLKLTSPGPIFFRQERVGYKGSRFMCLKFRTMRVGADTKGHQAYLNTLQGTNAPMVKLDQIGDARLIPGGWLVRATGVDELPQVINVIRKEMSIVGPRPCVPYEFEKYEAWQRERFNAFPGLTGLWQVSGKNRTTFDEMMHLDIKYARTRAFWLDIRIILMTVPALLVQIADTQRARRTRTVHAMQPARIVSQNRVPRPSTQTAIF